MTPQPMSAKTPRHTEIDGFRAFWQVDHRRGGIVLCALYEGHCALPLPEDHVDLVHARERWPRLAPLWDAVRHDFWSGLHTKS